MTMVVGYGQGGRGYDVNGSRVKILRSPDLEMLRNAETLPEAKRIDIDVDPVRGEKIQAMLAHVYSPPTEVVIKARQGAGS